MNSKIDSSARNETTYIPVINVSDLSREVADEILAISIKHGFLYIDPKGTGFTRDNVDRMFEVARKFFDSPEEQKRGCEVQDSKPGWVPFKSRTLDPEHNKKGDFREAFRIAELDSNKNTHQTIPEALKGCLDEILQFQILSRKLCMKILTAFGMSLEIEDPEFFSSRHQRPTFTTLGFNKYPALPSDDINPEIDIRLGAHSDYSTITLLFQQVGRPGLEIRTHDGIWEPVQVVPTGFQGDVPPIVVNFGDILHYWTNGLLKSTIHRVVFPKTSGKTGEDRYSIPVQFFATDSAKLLPLPSKMVRSMKPIEDGEQVGYGLRAAKTRPESVEKHALSRRANN